MLEFYKNCDIRTALRDVVCSDQIIWSLFKSVPELKSISFYVSNEYHDNNYYDKVTLETVNGHRWDSGEEGYVDDPLNEDEDEEKSNEPKLDAEIVECCQSLIDEIGKEFDCGETFLLTREDYTPGEKRTDCTHIGSLHPKKLSHNKFNEFVLNLASGNKIENESILKKFEAKWAVYYAFDHGRLSSEIENKIFAKKGNMREAYLYCVNILKDVLPKKIEDFHILNGFSRPSGTPAHQGHCSDEKYLKKYLEFKKTLVVE